jgi:5-amino-6-(5-phospho-D-ribitylamino)uracil phosphatase
VKYKLFAIDLDGTLLLPSGVVSARTKDAVLALVKAGARVCFATGRNFTESRAVLESVGHFDAAVFVGGALVYDTKRQETLNRTLMHPELAQELSRFFESHGHAALALQDTHTAGVDYLASEEFDLHGETERWLKVTNSKIRRVAQLADYRHEHTMRVSVVTSKARGTLVRGELNKAFVDRIVSHNFTSMFNDISVVEAFDPTVNKWQGVMHVAGMHGIRPEEVVAAGDDVNDIPMIQNAGLGVAMGNAAEEVKKVAKRVIKKNSEDGLAEFLEEVLAAN